MFGSFYNSSFRRYAVLMGDLFSNVKVARQRKEGEFHHIRVPITYASKERFMANLNRNSINNDDDRAKIETILPRMNLHMISVVYNNDLKTNTLNRTKGAPKNNALGTVTQYNPVPVKITYELGIYTRHQDDMFQILEQIIPYFQPHFNTTITELYDKDISFDRDIKVVLKDTSPDEQFNGDAIQRRHLEWLLTFDLNGWIYPPVDNISGEIKAVYVDFYNNSKELTSGGSFESVDSVGTKTDLSDIKQSYTHDKEIPEEAVLREN